MIDQIGDIIYSAVIGDASGYTLGGMKKAHIYAVFKNTEGYLDPAPALKNNMERWRKPGLYSSITQFMLITAACCGSRTFSADKFIEAIVNAPELPDTEYSYFRDPGLPERHLITSAGSAESSIMPCSTPCARILPIAIPLLLLDDTAGRMESAIKFTSIFTSDISTAAYTYCFLQLLVDLNDAGKKKDIMNIAAESAAESADHAEENQHIIFNSGMNPDYFTAETRRYAALIERLSGISDTEKAEKLICSEANSRLKSPVARGSVNLPETILPFAAFLSGTSGDPERIFQTASREGGAASALSAVSAAITSAFYGISIPAGLKESLANKKKIAMMIDMLSGKGGRGEIIKLLSESEPGLTQKETEEYKSKNRKEPNQPRQQKTRKDAESELTKHVVESWTKVDKAKWRKERNRDES